MSFMVHDKHGNVWPPQFKSELCDPDSSRTMIPNNRAKGLNAANAASKRAQAEGKGWAGGTLQHMQKPLLQKDSA